MKQEKITTSKMPGETEQQYTAWLLYCETKSISKMMRAWEGIRRGIGDASAIFGEQLGKMPARRNIEKWSVKYSWVKRADLRLAEELEELKEEVKKISQRKKHRILEVFNRTVNQRIKQLKEGEGVTTQDLKHAWEMATIEEGKPTSRFALREEEQKPLTDEEKQEKEKLDKLLKILYEQQGKIISPLLDTEQQNKRRKRRTNRV